MDTISRASDTLLVVLAGQPGCGKSVALYKFLEKRNVLWLSGRTSICRNLKTIGLNVNQLSEEECLFMAQDALDSNKFTLVIDDVQVLQKDSPMVDLFRHFGSHTSLPFPIYFTASDWSTYYTTIYPMIRRVVSLHWFSYPLDEQILNLTTRLGIDFNKTMRDVGPSPRLIQGYANDSSAILSGCVEIVNVFATFPDQLKTIIYDVTNLTFNDRESIRKFNYSEGVYNLVDQNFLTVGLGGLGFHNPLIRRAACTFFTSSNMSMDSCEFVSSCNEIKPYSI
ncbi:hypothetical protein P9112_012531 [Eukaryota sp. TZLM1-RC]